MKRSELLCVRPSKGEALILDRLVSVGHGKNRVEALRYLIDRARTGRAIW